MSTDPASTPTLPRRRAPQGTTALEDLVAACLDAELSGDRAACERLLEEQPELAAAARAQLADLASTGLLESPPETIGPYRVLELLGRGGMGEVYLAEQREPVQRRVAVKLIKRGMDTREVLARFHAERQALARMSHSSIARVYDAGSTPDGRPYFAMEYVDGLPLTTYCDRQALSTEARLALFTELCEGVQHAHWKGVLHRDLKPSNLLVTEIDGKRVPKVIDFGIAKALDEEAQSDTLHTARGAILGTPEYMSPEQASGASGDLDLRSDVYSLGVVLYELLTGDLPLAPRGSRRDLEEWLRALREETPSLPSRRFAREESETSARARARRATTRELRRRLHGDLDWICAKALAKAREERYATVGDLAADLRRHLAHEPVLAGPPSGLYRLRKFVRRYRWQVGAAALLFLSLTGGLIASSVFRWQAERALDGEQLARRGAERDFARAILAIESLLQNVDTGRLDGIPEAEPVRIRILEDADRFCMMLLADHSGDARITSTAALVKYRRAKLAQEMLDLDESAAACRSGLQLLETLPLEERQRPDIQLRRIDLLVSQSLVHHAAGRPEEDRAITASVEQELQQLVHEHPQNTKAVLRLMEFHANLAMRRVSTGEAEAPAALSKARGVVAAYAAHPLLAASVANIELQLARSAAELSVRQSEPAEAELELRNLQDKIASMFGTQESSERLRMSFWLDYLRNQLQIRTQQMGEAESAARSALAIATALSGRHPAKDDYRALVGVAHAALGEAVRGQKKADEARSEFRAAFELLRSTWRRASDAEGLHWTFAVNARNFATVVREQAVRDEVELARIAVDEALAYHRKYPTANAKQRQDLIYTLRLASDLDRAVGFPLLAAERQRAEIELHRAGRKVGDIPEAELLDIVLHESGAALNASFTGDAQLVSRCFNEVSASLATLPSKEHPKARVATAIFTLARAFDALHSGQSEVAKREAEEFANTGGLMSYDFRAVAMHLLLRVAKASGSAQRISLAKSVERGSRVLSERMESEPKTFAKVADLPSVRREFLLLRAGALALIDQPEEASAIFALHMPKKVEAVRGKLLEPMPEDRLALLLLLHAEASRTATAEATKREALLQLAERSLPRHALEAARNACSSGELDLALELLEHRANRYPPLAPAVLEDPALAPLAELPRFLELRRRLAP